MQETVADELWHYEENGKRKDGIPESEIISLIQSGKLGYGSVVWKKGWAIGKK